MDSSYWSRKQFGNKYIQFQYCFMGQIASLEKFFFFSFSQLNNKKEELNKHELLTTIKRSWNPRQSIEISTTRSFAKAIYQSVVFSKSPLKWSILETWDALFHMTNVTSSDNLISNGSDLSLNTTFQQGYFGNLQSFLKWGMSEASFSGCWSRISSSFLFPLFSGL